MMHRPAAKAEHRFYVLGREDLLVDHIARKTWRVLGECARHVIPQFVLSTILPSALSQLIGDMTAENACHMLACRCERSIEHAWNEGPEVGLAGNSSILGFVERFFEILDAGSDDSSDRVLKADRCFVEHRIAGRALQGDIDLEA